MNLSRCPRCRKKLGNFLYSDACPACGSELAHNTRPLVPAPRREPGTSRSWPIRFLLGLRRLVES